VLQTGFAGREICEKFLNRCAGLFFLRFHATNIRQCLPYVNGIIPFQFVGHESQHAWLHASSGLETGNRNVDNREID
jgi:hypothetical protein